jgi:hypothetical protein
MSSVHLESWVTQQYKEIGFGKSRSSPFIGKAALKRELINRYPMHKERIRQLVNAIKVPETPRRSVPASQPLAISSQTGNISQTPASPWPSKSKIALPYSALIQPKQVPLTTKSKMSATSSQNSDSGFASRSEDVGNTTSSSSPRNMPTINFQSYSPRSEDGGATLEAFLSTLSRSGTITETSEKLGTITPSSSNTKILGKCTISSNGTS